MVDDQNNVKMWVVAIGFTASAIVFKNINSILSIVSSLLAIVFWVLTILQIEVHISNHRLFISKINDAHRFHSDEKYRQKIISEYANAARMEHENNIKKCRAKIDKLNNQRINEIQKQRDSDWVSNESIQVNETGGLVRLNGIEYLFSSIKGAKLNCIKGERIESSEVENEEVERTLSGKGGLVGGIAGGVIGGLTGGIVGAAIGATALSGESRQRQQTFNRVTVSTCDYLGVTVDMDGFEIDIPILKGSVDQSSHKYRSALNKANSLIILLKALAVKPVYYEYDRSLEKRAPVLEYDRMIEDSKHELALIESEPVRYQLPDKYNK